MDGLSGNVAAVGQAEVAHHVGKSFGVAVTPNGAGGATP
jgi:hypothetical protein